MGWHGLLGWRSAAPASASRFRLVLPLLPDHRHNNNNKHDDDDDNHHYHHDPDHDHNYYRPPHRHRRHRDQINHHHEGRIGVAFTTFINFTLRAFHSSESIFFSDPVSNCARYLTNASLHFTITIEQNTNFFTTQRRLHRSESCSVTSHHNALLTITRSVSDDLGGPPYNAFRGSSLPAPFWQLDIWQATNKALPVRPGQNGVRIRLR